jgi:glycosyltransferase involved in cell wall biosynthesis
MSVYNTDFTLVKRAIDSVLNQDFQDFELLLIDDGSNNDSRHQMLNYAIKNETKITYLRHNNCGQSLSINRGILNSKGDYIAIIDADDEYRPNHLSACMQQMAIADLIASTTKTIVDTEADYYVPDKYDLSQLIHVDDCVLFATLFGKKEVFASQLFLDTYAADAHFYEHAAQQYRVRKVDLRTYIYYRNTPNSICSTMKRTHTHSFA